jgi:hypothetical protein
VSCRCSSRHSFHIRVQAALTTWSWMSWRFSTVSPRRRFHFLNHIEHYTSFVATQLLRLALPAAVRREHVTVLLREPLP